MEPPGHLASAFYPARGLYSSADRLVLGAQMAEIKAAGVDVVVARGGGEAPSRTSDWRRSWPRRRAYGLRVAAHVEPYADRTPSSTRADVEYLRGVGITDVYVYGVQERAGGGVGRRSRPSRGAGCSPRRRWPATPRPAASTASTRTTSSSSGGGCSRGSATSARGRGLLCAPSVGPGYDARRDVATAA